MKRSFGYSRPSLRSLGHDEILEVSRFLPGCSLQNLTRLARGCIIAQMKAEAHSVDGLGLPWRLGTFLRVSSGVAAENRTGLHIASGDKRLRTAVHVAPLVLKGKQTQRAVPCMLDIGPKGRYNRIDPGCAAGVLETGALARQRSSRRAKHTTGLPT